MFSGASFQMSARLLEEPVITVSHCFHVRTFSEETGVIALTCVAVFWKKIWLSCSREVDIFARYGAL